MDTDCVDILLVEDSPGDVRLVTEALKEAKVRNRLHVSEDGVQALEYLTAVRDGKAADPVPGLILLDLNLPRMNGQEVLAEIKADPKLRSIPVVIMTASQAETDIAKAYDNQANCYITKPVDFTQLMTVVRSIENFWLSVVQLPRSDS